MKQDLTIPHGALDGIEAFLRVAERRSFSAAAADLGVSPSAISQTVKALEARVGAPLFMRTTRSVGLTQAGEMFLERAAPAYAGLADAYEAARNLGNRPAGRLRINLMRGAVQPMFEPIIAGFVDAYPEIELEIYADDALADLSAGGFDAGVRMGESLDADVIAIRLTGPFRFVAAASPAEPAADDIGDRIAALRLHEVLAGVLGGLSPADRELVLLVAWAELSYEQAAQALQIPIGTVRSRLHRVRAKVRHAVDPADVAG